MNKTNPGKRWFWDLMVLAAIVLIIFVAYWMMQGYVWAFNRGL